RHPSPAGSSETSSASIGGEGAVGAGAAGLSPGNQKRRSGRGVLQGGGGGGGEGAAAPPGAGPPYPHPPPAGPAPALRRFYLARPTRSSPSSWTRATSSSRSTTKSGG